MTRTAALARWFPLSIILLLGALLLFLAPALLAQSGNIDLPPVTIPAGKDATLTIKAFCVEYTTPFAKDFPPLTSLADPKYTSVLRYALSKGYVDSDPYQVQLALWRAQTGRWVNNAARVRAEEIFNNAQTQAPAAAAAVNAPTLLDALKMNNVTVTYKSWTPVQGNLPDSVQPWLGVGEIVVSNKGTAPVALALPQGIFLDAKQGEQDMLLFFTAVQVQATETPAPTVTRAATPTPMPMPAAGGDTPDDLGYLVFTLGAFVIIGGLALDLLRRQRAMRRT